MNGSECNIRKKKGGLHVLISFSRADWLAELVKHWMTVRESTRSYSLYETEATQQQILNGLSLENTFGRIWGSGSGGRGGGKGAEDLKLSKITIRLCRTLLRIARFCSRRFETVMWIFQF